MKQKYKVLAIDDDAKNLKIVEEIFSEDYRIETMTSGRKALELLPHVRPEIILLDIMMPEMDGYTVCQKIRESPVFRYTKIILVSAKGMLHERLKGYASGADDYIVKPFDDNELLAKVDILLRLIYTEERDNLKTGILNIFTQEASNPLMELLGFAKILKQSPYLSRNDKMDIETIYENGYSIWKLARKIKLYCQLRDFIDLSILPVALNELVEDVLKDVKTDLDHAKIAVSCHYALESYHKYPMDHSLMMKAIYYIFDHMLQSSPEQRTLSIVTEAYEDFGVIRITDPSQRMNAQDIDFLFDAFLATDAMSLRKDQGLSLAIARLIIDMHGGQLKAEVSSAGLSFVVRLVSCGHTMLSDDCVREDKNEQRSKG